MENHLGREFRRREDKKGRREDKRGKEEDRMGGKGQSRGQGREEEGNVGSYKF